MKGASIPVLYIAGAGRSGSTLLEMILGNLPGYCSVGEVRYFWEYWAEGDRLCGCGRPMVANMPMVAEIPLVAEMPSPYPADNASSCPCPFWSAVAAHLPAEKLNQLRDEAERFDRTRNLPLFAAPVGNPQKPPASLIEGTAELYNAIWEVSGRQVIVDSSKVPSHLYILQQLPNIDLRVLHLVRDGRAVAYSWRKRQKQELGKASPGSAMPSSSTLKSLIVWNVENFYATKFGRRAPHYALMRYEDFTSNPAAVLTATLAQLGLDSAALKLYDGRFSGSPTHSVGGNPLRFNRANFQIKLDNEWKTSLSGTAKLVQGLAIYPMLRRFGYSLS